ncbi:hypothetical protein BCR32DRAFT_248627 [Anaeromyces robustus]|uniref:AAA-ATPase-like domain-containing protein n=1 Tax=Anaeromyces robustus TaxID=1754192 RepID=A0A1Y1WTJ8_9FUNG|nr:hypothetical protein BCR32DRAFT_248627 [Anaeromyces robustus]|eukprot:ORX76566.1 hypothetical protein BCR32DRAFT_248627 [Anaeromyces robustus]
MSNIYFNPGEENFSKLLNSNVYVDKTELILHLNNLIDTNNNAICVSCPSGFGKTYTVNMLTAYYCNTDKKITIFDDKKISKTENWDKYLGKFNVIKLNMANFFTDENIKNGLKKIKKLILNEIKKNISNFEFIDENNFSLILNDIYYETNKKIVLIIDEWDYIFQNNSFDKESIEKYKNFLKTLINNTTIALIYITGILPMLESEYKISDNYSMISPEWMAKYFGFNENEIEELWKKLFGSEMHYNTNNEKSKKIKLDDGAYGSYGKTLNQKLLINNEELIHKNDIKLNLNNIKNWYNGYQLIDNIYGKKYNIYSSYSVVEAIKNKAIDNYWNKLSSMESIIENIQINLFGLKDIINLLINSKRIKINVTSFESDMTIFNNNDDILTLFVHYGFLGYDSNTKEVYIPNEEVRTNFENFIKSEKWEILNIKRHIFNPDDENFDNILNSEYYVDKTELILYLNKRVNTIKRFICDSRPRGFGKTITAEMVSAYYSFNEIRTTIFNNKKISKSENQNWDKYLGKFNVIKLNMMKFFGKGESIKDGLDKIKKGIIKEVKMVLPKFKFTDDNEIVEIFYDIENHTGRKIVLIIDEYDYVLRKSDKNNNIKQEDYLDYLKFLNILVSDESYLALVYMTGILPIKKSYDQSKLNNLYKYSMISPFRLAKYFGFLEDEVKELCTKFNIPVEQNDTYRNNNELLNDPEKEINFNIIKSWYGGYKLMDSEKRYDVYKPLSIIKAIENKTIDNYWDKSSSIESIIENIQINLFGLKDIINLLMNSKKIKINVTSFKSDMTIINNKDDILTLFVHYGFLGYDSNTKEVYIPNEEVRTNFENFIKSEKWEILNIKRHIFNPNEDLDNILNSEYYVDKTELILYLNKRVNTIKRFICDSRPRGFGKTITAEMVSAYYSFNEIRTTIFNNKKISKSENQNWDKYLGKFNVIKLNMMKFFGKGESIKDGLDKIKKGIIKEIKMVLPEFKFTDENEIVEIFYDIENHTGRKIVLIIDEYDYLLRKSDKYNNTKQEDYFDYLKHLTVLIKDKPYLALVYMTGILPIKKSYDQSELNNFNEYSMISPFGLAKYFGFLEDEVKELCTKFNIPVEQNDTYRNNNELLNDPEKEINFNIIKSWYGGYKLMDSEKRYDVYKPLSIINVIEDKTINNYWNMSSSMEKEPITECIEMDFFGLKEDIIRLIKENKKIKTNVRSFRNDMKNFEYKDDVLTMLVHFGYLGYDKITHEVFIPNKEMRQEFLNITKSKVWDDVSEKLTKSKMLLEKIWEENSEEVAKLIEEYHDNEESMDYNSEICLKYTLKNAFYVADQYYNCYDKFFSGKGYAVIAYVPININSNYPALIIELKYEKDAETVIKEIKKKNYNRQLSRYEDNMLLIGISYDNDAKSTNENSKHHTCIIEKFQKN